MRGYFCGLFFCNEFWFFFRFFEVATVKFAVIHKIATIFFDKNTNTAGDWDRDNSTDKAESVDTDSNGGKNGKSW